MMHMMKKAQKAQSEMKKMQDNLQSLTFQGEASSGLISVEITGQGYANSINIDESLLTPEDREDLEDLIIVAFNSARDAMETHINSESERIMGDLQLPAGFKMPF